MGLWEEYCVLCGGPASMEVTVLRASFDDQDYPWKRASSALRGTAWLNNFSGCEVYVGDPERRRRASAPPRAVGKYTWYGAWQKPGESEFQSYTNYRLTEQKGSGRYGVAFHTKCKRLLCKHGCMPSGDELWAQLSRQEAGNALTNPKHRYGGLSKYHGQEFDYLECVKDKNAWMLQDPLTHERNARRILGFWDSRVKRRAATRRAEE